LVDRLILSFIRNRQA